MSKTNIFKVHISKFQVKEIRFNHLQDVSSRRKFCDRLEKLCSLSESLNSEATADQLSSSGASKKRSFREEVQMMRNLHPENNDPDKLGRIHRFLKQSMAPSMCYLFFGCIDRATFGGKYREQIYCACLPGCCYEELLNIFQHFRDGLILSTKQYKEIPAGLFRFFVVCRDEPRVHRLLGRFSTGVITMEQFRSASKELKENQQKDEDLKDVFEYAEDLEQTEPTVRKTYQRKVTAEVEVHLEEAHKKRRIQKEKEERYIELIDEIIREDEAETTEVTEAIEEDNEVVENIQEVTNEVTFSKGEKITAFWEDKNISGWYPAVVLRVNKNSYYVRFFDGVKSSLKPKDIKKTAN
ncbi:PHF20 [Mytilus edulis]|uniref:PHF20 n=1 Tax=Mytilus edulis TaxID=6550 RepID=A0A8S3PZN0_MYTED|nr:PHF20 [Mytilus edulis]